MDMIMMQIQDEGERDMAMARAFGNTCGYCDGLMHETADCTRPERYLADAGCGHCGTLDHAQYEVDSDWIACGEYAAAVRVRREQDIRRMERNA